MSFYNRVKESGRIIGSGNIELLGAYNGYINFVSAFQNNGTCYYTFESSGTTVAWEVGYGSISGSIIGAHALYRNTIYNTSSQGSNRLNAPSGIYTIFSSPPAKHFDDIDMITYMGMI